MKSCHMATVRLLPPAQLVADCLMHIVLEGTDHSLQVGVVVVAFIY